MTSLVSLKSPTSLTSPKLFVLRHEQRGNTIDFNTSLTDEGLHKANTDIKHKLLELSIDEIYCSPFVRTLQTIYPFCKATGNKVKLEWSLVESIPCTPHTSSQFNSIIDLNYKSFSPYSMSNDEDILNFQQLQARITAFISHLNKVVPNKNILLVTHMPIINAILASRGVECIDIYTYHKPGSLLSISRD